MSAPLTIDRVYQCLANVMDPEIPVLSVVDLGMITAVELAGSAAVTVKMIPTYAACPALQFIQRNIQVSLERELQVPVLVQVDATTHWHSNRLTAAARQKLEAFALAPPPASGKVSAEILLHTPCPHCGSKDTYMRSPFGATLCRATHFCKNCGQLFEQFKPLE